MKFGFFKKTLIINEDATKPYSILYKSRTWCFEWNKTFAGIFAFLMFLLMMFIFIYCKVECKNWCLNQKDRCVSRCFQSKVDRNVVKCENLVEGDVNFAEEINKAFLRKPKRCLQVTIKNCTFKSTTLKKGWLSAIKYCVKVLELNGSNVAELGERSFEGHPFKDTLKILVLANSMVSTLKKATFGKTQIESFRFQNDVFAKALTAEKKALDGMSKTLWHLQINGCLVFEETVANLTGKNGAWIDSLRTIDFSRNHLNSLGAYFFAKTRYLTSIYLNDNFLDRIDQKAFFSQKKLKKLHISFNKLKTIPDGLFDSMKTSLKLVRLDNNLWECNCSLSWLKEFCSTSNCTDQKLLCANYNKTFEEVDFCPSSTTITMPTTTAHPKPKQVLMYCKKISKEWSVEPDLPVVYFDTILIRGKSINFSIFEMDNAMVGFRIEIVGTSDKWHLIWFVAKNQSDHVCLYNLDDTIQITNVQRQSTYVMCFLYDTNDSVSPLDCSAISVPPSWDETKWISQNGKYVAIGAIFGTIFIAATLTALITYICIRRHPKMIKGSQRLMFVENMAEKAIVLPKNKRNTLPLPIGRYSTSTLQPNLLLPNRVPNRPLRRSVSDCSSVFSETASYATAIYASAENSPQSIRNFESTHQNRNEIDGMLYAYL